MNIASLLLLIAAAAVVLSTATAQSPAEAPGPSASSLDCTSYLLNMSDCLSYVEAGSNLTVPEAACCPELAGMVGSKPVCLCELLSSAETFGIQISLSKAMDLPSACGVETPPVSTCTELAQFYDYSEVATSVATTVQPAVTQDSVQFSAGYPIGGSSPTEAPKSPGDLPVTAGSKDSGSSSILVSQLLCSIGLAIATLSTHFWL